MISPGIPAFSVHDLRRSCALAKKKNGLRRRCGNQIEDLRIAYWLKTREPAMFKIGLTALAITLTFASAKAVDNAASANAAAAFSHFGLQGLAVAVCCSGKAIPHCLEGIPY
jgi:hypothetical protein